MPSHSAKFIPMEIPLYFDEAGLQRGVLRLIQNKSFDTVKWLPYWLIAHQHWCNNRERPFS